MKLRFEMAAVDEAEEVVRWVEQRRAGQGDAFIDTLAKGFDEIAANPLRYPKLETVIAVVPDRDIRRYVLRPFPHFIVYEIIHNTARILAVVHPSREPTYWIDRL